jgi:hypothetical protein
MAVKSFETKAREKQVVEFELDGETFRFTPPKRAELIMSVVSSVGLDGRATETDSVRDLLNWIGEGLSEEQSERILGRLRDQDDDFDLEQLNEIARYLLGQSSNRPTRRRSGS